jgi:hypothetical protein
MVPAFQERNARCVPSGDHTGAWLTPSAVIFVVTSRSGSYVYRSWFTPSISKAICRPSGEMRGNRYERAGSGNGAAFPWRSTHTSVRCPPSALPTA